MARLGTAEQLSVLLTLQRELALENDVDRVLDRICLATTTLLDAARATLYVVDVDLNLVWSRVLSGGELEEVSLRLDGTGLAAEVARTGETLVVGDPYGDPRFDPSIDARSGFRTTSLLVMPIESRDGHRLGLRSRPRAWCAI